ncbi:hypothetical protein JOF29_007767 [Kribbella aluminosa]|uniref:ARB-07466-like C-terminal domain-containing protein n=1 Tax=Kribbella aluminosa TaxID=416017 RepID=A0ABS4UYG6_9ACTN|nr:hypothetical protein [Kribbella aluminosa]MBP2356657.1 hypothetical protein [Kribbella aluminosa]
MFSSRDLAEASGLGAARSVAGKAALIGGLVLLMVLVMLAPFGARTKQVSSACPPNGPGNANDPVPTGQLRVTQIAYAKIIDSVAVARGLPGQATLVALMTALQESQLQNLSYGDRDSVGLFQQRPSTGWGTVAQLMDPAYAANAFFGGAQPPSPPGLVDINNWYSMPFTVAAQAVQRSAFPDAYARHEDTARSIAEQAGIDLNRTGDPYAGRSGSHAVPSGVSPSGAAIANQCGGGLVDGRPIAGNWPPEKQNVPDPTGTGGMVTPRTAAWVAKARSALPNLSITCWDAHLWNPTSDHPKGKACDVMVGADSRKSATARTKGDQIANWTLQTAATTGVRYVIWYGKIWSARTGVWRVYNGGGIYNPNDVTGGHYDHVHVSMY